MAGRQPQVSIVITCYNYGEFVSQAIESVFKQTYQNLSLTVINDGSTDNSDRIITSLNKKYDFTYVIRPNRGVVATRNQAIDLSTGEYLLLLDADDYLDSDYVEKTVRCLELHGSDIAYTNVRRFGEENYVTNFPKFSLEELKNHNFIHISSLVRTSVINELRFDKNLDGMTHEDWDFFLNLCINGAKAELCELTFLNYRIHDSARNNRFGDDLAQRKYIDVYAYVIDKYAREQPKQFNYLAGRVFADWYASIDDERMVQRERILRITSQRDVAAIKLYGAERELELIANSKKYKTIEKISLILHPKELLRKNYRLYKKLTDKRAYLNRRNMVSVARAYKSNLHELKAFKRSERAKLAIVVHLYYPDMWPEFKGYLAKMNHLGFDLFISIPKEGSIRKEINKSYPDAYVFVAPNRGRDVLPFMWIMQTIKKLGYTYVLKVHSKKSKHRQDGNKWFKGIINTLIPEDKTKSQEIINYLSDPKTAVIGPDQEYVSLEVNYEQNKHYFNKLLADFKIDDIRKELHNYGFFAGTMFWARVEAFDEVLSKQYGVKDFQLEAGQIDGTFAHGLERIFCVLPETKSKKIYSIDSKGTLVPVDYSSGKIPEWSDLYAK